MINVRDHGARGDGEADDAGAIEAALAQAEALADGGVWTPHVYLPPGVYKVGRTLEKRDVEGRYDSGMMLRGAGAAHTTIRLADAAPGFGSPSAPRAVIFTSSHLWDQGGPYGGGKDWPGRGEGNQAFQNYLQDLTVDVGRDNPGAIGIDFLGNNACAIRDVLVRDRHGAGAIGLSMTRKWPGPCLIDGLRVEGFDIGVSVADQLYSIAMRDVSLMGQRRVGLRNAGNIIAVEGLDGDFEAVAVENADPSGLIVLHRARLRGAPGARAFEGVGVLRAAGVSATGFAKVGLDPQPSATRDLVYLDASAISNAALTLPPPPPFASPPPFAGTVSVAAFGAAPGDGRDDTAAVQAAFDSGAADVYFPFGVYRISQTLRPCATTRRLIGMNAVLVAPADGSVNAVFSTEEVSESLSIEDLRLRFGEAPIEGHDGVWISHDGPGELRLRDVFENAHAYASTLLGRADEGGPAALENVCCGKLKLAGPEPVRALHLNTEGPGLRIDNDGAPLTVLGLKTEMAAEVVRTRGGGVTEILGGLLYPVRPTPPDLPAFRVVDGAFRATIADTAFAPGQRYSVMVQSGSGDALVEACDDPGRIGTILLGTTPLHPDDAPSANGATCR